MASNSRANLLPWTILLIGLFAFGTFAQEADSRFPGQQKNDQDQPVGLRETQEKMRIEQAKKEYEEMLDRGEQALKLSQELEKAFAQQPSLTRSDLEKLDDLEKLVKKIRGELGGGNGDDADDSDQAEDTSPKTVADAVKSLQSVTGRLVDELKKTSRFGISAVAIQSSNSVLKIVHFLRVSK
jgi:hypothetical protein